MWIPQILQCVLFFSHGFDSLLLTFFQTPLFRSPSLCSPSRSLSTFMWTIGYHGDSLVTHKTVSAGTHRQSLVSQYSQYDVRNWIKVKFKGKTERIYSKTWTIQTQTVHMAWWGGKKSPVHTRTDLNITLTMKPCWLIRSLKRSHQFQWVAAVDVLVIDSG